MLVEYNLDMKKIIVTILIVFVAISEACTGDCMSCHPNLLPTINEDLRHKPMLTCINCHKADTESMAECGSDCFACHDVDKIEKKGIFEHKVIRSCRDCHMQMKRELSDITKPKDQSQINPLDIFLAP